MRLPVLPLTLTLSPRGERENIKYSPRKKEVFKKIVFQLVSCTLFYWWKIIIMRIFNKKNSRYLLSLFLPFLHLSSIPCVAGKYFFCRHKWMRLLRSAESRPRNVGGKGLSNDKKVCALCIAWEKSLPVGQSAGQVSYCVLCRAYCVEKSIIQLYQLIRKSS